MPPTTPPSTAPALASRYAGLLDKARAAGANKPSRSQAMRLCIDLLWGAFGNTTAKGPMSWVGFYEKTPDADEMILLVREPKPACSPLGMNGMCGRCWKERRPLVVEDVRKLSKSDYIACDPRDISEVVVPCFNADGTCWGVMDADSFDPRSFDEDDARGMAEMMVVLGLTTPEVRGASILKL